MDEFTTAELDELERLAKAASPGPWFTSDWHEDDGPHETTIEFREPEQLGPGQSSIWPDGLRRRMVASTDEADGDTIANAKFIATANPATILRLIAAARR